MNIVYLEWVDVCSYAGWLDDDSEVDVEPVKTVGFVADEKGDYIGAIVIPKGWINERKEIEL